MINRHGGIGRLLLVLLALSAVWYFWAHIWPIRNLRVFSGQLEKSVNEALVSAGFSDRMVVSQVRREQSRWGLVWFETTRELRPEKHGQQALLKERLQSLSQVAGCRILERSEEGRTVFELSRWFATFQRLIVLPVEGAAVTAPAEKRPEVALVIDDVAYDLTTMDRYAALQVPLTFAILPRHKLARPLADKATSLGFPVILHLPMEPIDRQHNDPGPSGLFLNMTPKQLRDQFERDVESVPHIVGINNHMGSAFTESLEKMTMIMRWVKRRGLFFLDSHTSSHSVVSKAARAASVPCLVNETFLDNADEVGAIERQLDLVMKLAQQRGRTIAIGHYRRKHLVEALSRKLPEFQSRGVRLVPLTAFYPPAHG
jgi:polysaccharide deacetylase 2 family uncharacterized protein YibQ